MASQSLSIWTNELTLEFLDLYKSEEAIWDPSHPQHKSRHDIVLAWKRIRNAMSLNISVADLKKKKEALMATFRFNCHKKKRNQSFVSPWFAWPIMESFLGSIYKSNSTQLEHQFFTSDEYDGYEKLETDDDPISIQKSEDSPVNRQSRYKISTQQSSQKTLQLTVKGNSDNESNATKKMRKNGIDEDIDECDLYAELLARKLKRLDEHQRDIAMHDIDMIMFRAKMHNGIKHRKEQNYSTSSPSQKGKSPIFIVTPKKDTNKEEAMTYEEVEPQHSP